MHFSRSIRRGIDGAHNLRKHMHRTGRTLSGHYLWTQDELDILEDLWPDKGAIGEALPRRTLGAICKKACDQGLTTPRNFWKPDEKRRMAPPYKAGVPVVEIQAKEVPDRTKRQIYGKASHMKIRRPRRPPKPTGMRIVDLIRERAFSQGYTMRELDEWAGRGRYFVSPQTIDAVAVLKILRIMGGKIVASWPA